MTDQTKKPTLHVLALILLLLCVPAVPLACGTCLGLVQRGYSVVAR